MAICVWFFVLIGNSVLVFSSVEVSENLLLKPGDDASLWCDCDIGYTRSPHAWIKWSDNGSKKIVAKKHFVVSDEKRISSSTFILFKTSRSQRVNRYSVSIQQVTNHDSGTYECQFELENGTVVSNKTSLLVFPLDDVVAPVSVLQGDSAELRCFSEKYPVFNVVWWRKAKQELPEGSYIKEGILTIPSTTVSDSDFYTCSADFHKSTNLKDTITRTMTLAIAPDLELTVRNFGLTRPRGYSVNLTCVIFSLSPVKVKWLKSEETIIRNEKYDYQLFENDVPSMYTKPFTKVAQLHIKNIDTEDYGPYSCVVENEFNVLSKYIMLNNPPFLITDDATETSLDTDFIVQQEEHNQ